MLRSCGGEALRLGVFEEGPFIKGPLCPEETSTFINPLNHLCLFNGVALECGFLFFSFKSCVQSSWGVSYQLINLCCSKIYTVMLLLHYWRVLSKTLTIRMGKKSMLLGRLRVDKQVVFATLGNCLECYDVTLYSFFATLLAPLFFPSDNPGLSLLMSFMAFALGMAMRPLGGIVFGHVGDKYGRKYALKTSLFLIVMPTLVIGSLPTYQQIGVTAPIVLVFCLLLQGLCVGGEYSGASVFVVEHTKKNSPGFWGAVLISSGFLGSLIGTLMGYLFTKYFDPIWGWRFPFLIGGVIGLIGFYRFYKLQETPDFQKVLDKKLTITSPLLTVLKKYPLNFMCVICVGGASFIHFYATTTYLGSVLSRDLGLPHSQIMLFYSLAMIIYLVCLPIMGGLGDRFGAKRMMIIGASPSSLSIIICKVGLISPEIFTRTMPYPLWDKGSVNKSSIFWIFATGTFI